MAGNIDIITAANVLARGLAFVGFTPLGQQQMSHEKLLEDFHAHYGCLPIDLSQMWYDLQVTNVNEARVPEEERNDKGFNMFMAANFFLWVHPKNAQLLASRFGVSKRKIQSNQYFWVWIRRMGALNQEKVKWNHDEFSDDDYFIYLASVDGVDFNVWEKPSERYNIDNGLCSFKSKHGALRYLVALSIWDSKAIYIHGPVKAGEVNDVQQFRLELKQRMLALPPDRLLILDKGYQTNDPDEVRMFALPNPRDDEELRIFKVRARMRHETFNGRLKFYKILQDTFRFDLLKHGDVFRAVCARVHYSMESGASLFDV